MGTFNFNKQKDFTTGMYQADELYTKSDYDDVDTPTDEEFERFLYEQTESELEIYAESVEEFKETLQFYNLELQAGCYTGFQSNVTSYFANDGERLISCALDNYATNMQYRMDLSTFKRKEQAEFNKIEKFIKKLFPQIMIKDGGRPIYSSVKKIEKD